MKISELMERLGEIQGEHGDLGVEFYIPGSYPYLVTDARYCEPKHAPQYVLLVSEKR